MENTKFVYSYDNEGYFVSKILLDISDKCQITGEWLIPAMTTEKETSTKDGYKSKFNGLNWEYEKIITNEEKKITGILELEEGEKIEGEKLIIINSPGEFYSWDYKNFQWIFDEDKKEKKINEIKQNSYSEIIKEYPEWKQNNITRMKDYNELTIVKYNKMINFIDEIRAYTEVEIMNLN